jgi:hypothetical protein
MGGILYLLIPFGVRGLTGIAFMILLGVIIYLAAMLFLAKEKIFETVNLVLGAIK